MLRSLLVAAASVALVSGCGSSPGAAPSTGGAARTAAGQVVGGGSGASGPDEGAAAEGGPDGAAEPSPGAGDTVRAQDALAGVLERTVPASGSGRTEVVPGAESAPRGDRLQRVRVEVEGGIGVDGHAFAAMVMTTLNDPRSWSSEGWTFARTDGDADLVVRLASPDLSERLCRPLRTRGTLSCRSSEGVILTHHRWVKGQEDYGDDLTGYRQYVVNHEVGHALGRSHTGCPEAGAPAPVMQQQTIDVDPCVPNPWVEP